MSKDPDFELVMQGYSLVTVNVIYYLPDQKSLVNEFMWQTLDLKPKYPRIIRFLDFWRKEIDAVIKDVMIADSSGYRPDRFRSLDGLFPLH